MLSASHTTSTISIYFNEFIRVFESVPDVFICDMSFALLNAAARCFGGSEDVWEYSEKLYEMCKFPTKTVRKPKCLLRIDRNHLIKDVASCDALKSATFYNRNFYIRSVCLVLQSSNLKQAEFLSRSILAMAYSKKEGNTRFVQTYLKCISFVTPLFI